MRRNCLNICKCMKWDPLKGSDNRRGVSVLTQYVTQNVPDLERRGKISCCYVGISSLLYRSPNNLLIAFKSQFQV